MSAASVVIPALSVFAATSGFTFCVGPVIIWLGLGFSGGLEFFISACYVTSSLAVFLV